MSGELSSDATLSPRAVSVSLLVHLGPAPGSGGPMCRVSFRFRSRGARPPPRTPQGQAAEPHRARPGAARHIPHARFGAGGHFQIHSSYLNDTLPFYFLGVLPSISALCAMSNSAKKKTTAMREVRAPQPGAAHQCRRLLFDWPLPRTHAHIFACRWLGACMPPPTPPAEVQQSPGVLLQQQNGPSVCFPNAGYRVISTCADPNRPVQRES